MKPSPKSYQVTEFLDNITKEMYGTSRTEAISGDSCVTCHGPATHFKDPLSRKEYTISGMCQQCQDATFGE